MATQELEAVLDEKPSPRWASDTTLIAAARGSIARLTAMRSKLRTRRRPPSTRTRS
ncbi:hypothetical protein [Nonomuraea fuscirosea]|uniref:hypothetical protein n=1 Tax=Nonomuraea fuscirosea TaxID=1291556 RepID=UPI0034241CE4